MKYKAKDFTAAEKIKLLAGKDCWHTEDFGGRLYEVSMSDGPLGLRTDIRNEKGEWETKPAVAYPATEVLSQTWNLELAYQTGKMLADDCIENGVDVLLAPGLNIKRDPLCGRNFEYVSEDPYVAGVFAKEYIRGLQEEHVGATVKHYCCNNIEDSRLWVSSDVDERPLREIYLRAFEIACEAKPWATMCSYNLVNGVRMSEHKKLYTVLRDEFGFDGIIMSDWDAVKDHAASVRAGLDLEMPYSDGGYENLKKAYEAGEVTDEQLDICAQRVLDFISRCEEESKKRKLKTTREQRLAAARKVAEEGIVLLKNDGILPLKKDARVSVLGNAANKYWAGDGSSRVRLKEDAPTLLDALKAALPDGEVSFAKINTENWWNKKLASINDAYGKDAAIVCIGAPQSEGWDRQSMKLSKELEQYILQTAAQNPHTVVVLNCGAAVDMTNWIDEVEAVLWAGYAGEQGQLAVADILTGKVNPSGKLTETFPIDDDAAPSAHTYIDQMKLRYDDGLLVGYRWYDMEERDGYSSVRFPFGYGLSYTQFAYSDLTLKRKGEEVEVSFDVKNIGSVAGAEVAQIYVREAHSCVFRPFKELKGFKKVYLAAGEKKRVTLSLDKRAFAFYSTALDRWTVNGGDYEIIVGASAEDIRLTASVKLD